MGVTCFVNRSRPPAHLPITLQHQPHLLLVQPGSLILEIHRAFELRAVQTQIAVLEQLLLHERAQRARSRDALVPEQVRPRLQYLFVHIVDDAVKVEAREGGDEGALETGGERAECSREERREGPLCCVARIVSRGDRPASRAFLKSGEDDVNLHVSPLSTILNTLPPSSFPVPLASFSAHH